MKGIASPKRCLLLPAWAVKGDFHTVGEHGQSRVASDGRGRAFPAASLMPVRQGRSLKESPSRLVLGGAGVRGIGVLSRVAGAGRGAGLLVAKGSGTGPVAVRGG